MLNKAFLTTTGGQLHILLCHRHNSNTIVRLQGPLVHTTQSRYGMLLSCWFAFVAQR